MKVFRPTDNPLTRGYSTSHKGYDFSGLNRPDQVRCGKDGEIVERVDLYATNWINTGTLTTKDYGNYIKVKHTDGTFELHAHLRKGSALDKGTTVKAGQIIARIGNTGNSTGPHLHSEYRNASNVNTQAEFYVEEATDTNKQVEELQKALEEEKKESAKWRTWFVNLCSLMGIGAEYNLAENEVKKLIANEDDLVKEQSLRMEADAKVAKIEVDMAKLNTNHETMKIENATLTQKAKEQEETITKQGEKITNLTGAVQELKDSIQNPAYGLQKIVQGLKELFKGR